MFGARYNDLVNASTVNSLKQVLIAGCAEILSKYIIGNKI